MGATVERIDKNRVKLTITASAEVFEQGIASAYLKERSKINVPGFRKGKAPRKVIENMYGVGVFYEPALDELLPDLVDEAIKAEELRAVSRPLIDIVEAESGKDLVFTAEIDIYPEVELGEYKGIEIMASAYTVSDGDVESALARELERQASWETVERPAANGDRVTIDYKGFVDSVPFEGGEAENAPLTLGEGRFIPGFEEQVEGMSAGDERDINVTFPEEYHAEELKGKPAVFKITLKDVKEKHLPELDDDFASDVSDFSTLDEYRADLKTKLEQAGADRSKREINDMLVERATAAATVDIPHSMVHTQAEYMMREFRIQLMYQGATLESYMEATQRSYDDIIEEIEPEAEATVKTQLVMEEIRKAEGIDASDEEVDAEIAKRAEERKWSVDEYIEKALGGDKGYIKDELMYNKTLELLAGSAKISYDKGESEE